MRLKTALVAVPIVAVSHLSMPSYGSERHHDAHVHGHASLNIAVEGKVVLMELEAPGADIVGFEHPAKSEADKAAIAAAKATLGDPASVISIDASAGCALADAKVELEGEEEAEDDHSHSHAHDHDHADEHSDEELHSEFHAEYKLTCDNPQSIASMAFPYFDNFAGAEELEVTIISEAGQFQYDVDRDRPRLNLEGL